MLVITRAEAIKYCEESAEEFGIEKKDYSSMATLQLLKEVEWFDHLWDK